MGLFDNETNWEHEAKAEVGDTIRAYDFQPVEGREDSYIDGVVFAKGMLTNDLGYEMYSGYGFKIINRVVGGKESDISNYKDLRMCTPFNDQDMDHEHRITRIA